MQQGPRKDSLRRDAVAHRSLLSPGAWRIEDTQRTAHLLGSLGDSPRTVAMYASRPGEPGTSEAVTTLAAAGWRVLLPLLVGTPGWATFEGWDRMRPGWGGIPQPLTPEPRPLDQADVVVVASLAVARDGTRLGTGGGWYDRALPLRRPGTPVWSLARTQELCDALPRESHDVAVDAVVTQDGMFTCGAVGLRDFGKPWLPELS